MLKLIFNNYRYYSIIMIMINFFLLAYGNIIIHIPFSFQVKSIIIKFGHLS